MAIGVLGISVRWSVIVVVAVAPRFGLPALLALLYL